MRTIEAIGKNAEEAIRKGLEQLGISREDAQIKVLDEGSRGVFGIFAKMARVEISAPDLPEPDAAPAPAAHTAEPAAEEAAPAQPEPQEPAPAPIDPATLSEPSRRAFAFLSDTARLMGLEEPGIAFAEDEHGLKVRVEGSHVGALIGHRGETLDALQLLTGLVVNHHQGENGAGYCRVTLDIGSYRAKREETLRALALRLAAKAKRSGRSVTLEPMNSYERRIIHSALHDYAGVTTYSEGDDPYRYVVIAPNK